MKTLAKFCLLPLLLAICAAPLHAQPDKTAASNAEVAPNPPPPPPAPEPDESRSPSDIKAPPTAKVHLDKHGIYLGGAHSAGGFGSGGLSGYEVAIAIVAIVTPFICIIAICGVIFESRQRKNRELHKTLRVMIEKGVPIPPELLAQPARSASNVTGNYIARKDLRTGIVFLALGVGLLLNGRAAPIGIIFLLLGGAFLLLRKFDKKEPVNSDVQQPK